MPITDISDRIPISWLSYYPFDFPDVLTVVYALGTQQLMCQSVLVAYNLLLLSNLWMLKQPNGLGRNLVRAKSRTGFH